MTALRALTWFGFSVAGSVLFAPRAQACSPPPPEDITVPSAMPPDGVLLGRLRCEGCTTADLEFRTEEGPVTGTFEAVSGLNDPQLFLFRPSATLPSGPASGPFKHLFVKVPKMGEYEYEVILAEADEPAAPLSARLQASASGAGETFYCEEYSMSSGGYCGLPNYASQTLVQASVWLSLEEWSQAFYRVTYQAGEVEVEKTGLFYDVQFHVFAGEPAEVCYTLEQIDPVGGAAVQLGDECFPTSDLELGLKDEVSGDPTQVLGVCSVPPEGAVDEWCAVVLPKMADPDYCAFETDLCANAEQLCDMGMGGMAGSGGGGAPAAGGSASSTGGGTSASGGAGVASGGKDSGGKDGGSGGATAAGGTDPGTGGKVTTEAPGGGCSLSGEAPWGGSAPWAGLALVAGVGLLGRRRARLTVARAQRPAD